MTLARIETRKGEIQLSQETGRWEGEKDTAKLANAIANLTMAHPENGDPVRWAVNEVNRVLRGVVEMPERKEAKDDGRVY